MRGEHKLAQEKNYDFCGGGDGKMEACEGVNEFTRVVFLL